MTANKVEWIAPNRMYEDPWSRPILSDEFDDEAQQYIHIDHHNALIAAAYQDAARIAQAFHPTSYFPTPNVDDWASMDARRATVVQIESSLLSRTPSDTQAALEAMLEEAKEEGRKEGFEEAILKSNVTKIEAQTDV